MKPMVPDDVDAWLFGVGIAGIQHQKALDVDLKGNGGKGELRVRSSSNQEYNHIQGFRFHPNPLRYALRIVAESRLTQDESSENSSENQKELANLFFLGFTCLASVQEQSIPKLMELLDSSGQISLLTTMELVHGELQSMYLKFPNDAQQALEILASHTAGHHIILRLYFGGWDQESVSGPKYAWNDFDSLLDPQAFLSEGYGRIAMNGFYHLLFTFLVSASLLQGEIYEFDMALDSLLLAFLVGQVAEEGKEFWTQPRYLRNFWNILDVVVIVSLTMYFFFMKYESVSRTALSICVLFLLFRLLGALRNTQLWDLGMLVRTTVAMLGSIMSFMLMYLFVIGAFSAAFYFLFSLEAIAKNQSEGTASARLLHGRAGGSKSSTSSSEQSVFTHFWSLCLWLFNASLGDFHFDEFKHSEFRLAGVAMLLLFLIVCTVTLLNFMIAILSATFEDQQNSSRKLYILDLGVDALEKPYRPNLALPPWMPRPLNILNMLVYTLFAITKAPFGLGSPWLQTLDR